MVTIATKTSNITFWHVTSFHTIHKGSKKGCKKCVEQKKPSLKSAGKKNGSTGGKKSGRKRRSTKPPRLCGDCQNPISQKSASGYCMGCLRERRKNGLYIPPRKGRKDASQAFCDVCKKPISRVNKTGMCRPCWNKAPKTIKGRQKSQAWVNAAVFRRNATKMN